MMYANNVLMDRVTVDIFDEFTHSNRTLNVFDVNPTTSGDLSVFPSTPIITWDITENTNIIVDGLKYVHFNGVLNTQVSTVKLKTAMRWFTVNNFNGEFLYGARVGTFLHGFPLNTERLIVKPLDLHELYTFQLRVEMDELAGA